jgi:hypothetical protein
MSTQTDVVIIGAGAAGEATARSNGTCNGAYWSGVRAAREVAEVLK